MRKVLFGLTFFCYACGGEQLPAPPQNLIPTEKMIPLIVDLQILEAHFQRSYQRPDIYKASLDSSSALIFKKYNVTKTDFDSSYSYYSKDVDVIYAIYEAALDSVNFRLSQPGL